MVVPDCEHFTVGFPVAGKLNDWQVLPSVLWCCWLGGRKGIQPVKTEWCGAGMVVCLERGADLHTAQLMPLTLTVSCFSKIQIGFTFLVPAHLGSPGQRAVKRVCVCVVLCGRVLWSGTTATTAARRRGRSRAIVCWAVAWTTARCSNCAAPTSLCSSPSVLCRISTSLRMCSAEREANSCCVWTPKHPFDVRRRSYRR